MSNVYIQYEGILGDWNTCNTMDAPVSDTSLRIALQNMKLAKPNSRVRAIDDQGRLLDLWP